MGLNLAAFPADILGLMLSNESHSYLAVELWKTGDSRITEKLASGLTYLNLTGATSTPLPRLLTSLRALRDLTLRSDGYPLVKDPSHWLSITKSLSKTLRSLVISSKDSNYAVLNWDPIPGSGATNYIMTDYKRGPSSFIDLGTLFPQLETLVLKQYRETLDPGYSNDLDSASRTFELQYLAGVPDTVTRLGLPDLLLGCQTHAVKLAPLMPASLRFLDTPIFVDYHGMSLEEILQDWDLPNLESVQSLEWLYRTPETISWLPRTIKRCTFTQVADYGLNFNIAKSLPPALEQIYLDDVIVDSFGECEGSWISTLPRKLTKLSIGNGGLRGNIADLPRTLRKLSLQGFRPLDILAEFEEAKETSNTDRIWPPSLKNLEASISGLEKGVLSLLPHSLNKLEVSLQEIDARLDGQELPPGLTELRLSIDSGLAFTGPFHSSLTAIAAHCYSETPTGGRVGLSAESLLMLPKTLQDFGGTLELPKRANGDENPEYELISSSPVMLPPHLVTLHVNEFHLDWLASLPRTLLNLGVSSLHGTSNIPEDKAPTLFADLPPLLFLELNSDVQNLEAGYSQERVAIGRFPSASLRSLPRTLTSIHLLLSEYNESDDPFLNVTRIYKTYLLPTTNEGEAAAVNKIFFME